MTTSNEILIIGGGIAGLILAQGLKHRNIPFSLYERDSQSTTKGYRFRVVDAGLDALQATLPPTLWSLLEATHPASSPPHLPLYNAVTGTQTFYKQSPDSRSYPIDRRWIRELLLIGIEKHVHFGKSFQEYELLDGGVKVHFSDGASVTGRLLVGADGVSSRVRRQCLPQVKLLDVERTVLWCRTPLSAEFEERFNRPDILNEHFAAVLDPVDRRRSCLFAPVRWPSDGKLSSLSPKLSDQSDYMFAALSFETPPHALSTPELRKEYALRISEGWNEGFRSLFHLMSESSAIPIRSSRPDVEVWETDERITLMGDAIHAMSPSGGSGGLTAILDAEALTKTLEETWDGEGWGNLQGSLEAYERGMRERAKNTIEVSFQGGKLLWEGKDWSEYKEVATK